ncbi:MAG: hypothetical protein WBG92_07175 [Thiohalocapsa sp.]
MSESHDFRYQPFYCEENAWWLCGESKLSADNARVLFVFNRLGHCPFAAQRAAPPNRIVCWDYHVVLLDCNCRIWDLDTRLGLPLPALDWLAGSFPFIAQLPPDLSPLFRMIPCLDYRRDFASDRSHMREHNGRWHRPPPPWPPIGEGMNLSHYRDQSADAPGELLTWDGLQRRLGDG